MRFLIEDENPVRHACQVLVLGCFTDRVKEPFFKALDEQLRGCLSSMYEQKEFTGELNKVKLVHTLGGVAPERVLLLGLGRKKELSTDKVRQACGTAAQVLRMPGIKNSGVLLPDGGRHISAAVEGFSLGAYSFDCYKTKEEEPVGMEKVTFLLDAKIDREAVEKAIEEADVVCQAVCLARDLVSQPGNVAGPAFLAEKARNVAEQHGLSCTVWEREDIERHSMGALLAVSRGSSQSPKFVCLRYLGGEAKARPTVLVGKGITFDSGGISLKSREGMEKMKSDMAGAAAVLATLMAVADLKLPLNLVGLVPLAENLPGGNAYRPGDIITSMSGKTVEVVNTDAEGRLILCDALHHAQSFRPAALIDVATLTGACVVALGGFATGLLGNDETLLRDLTKAGTTTGERVWELPLWDEYGEVMKSDVADLKNSGGTSAGTISAAWFLNNFVGKTPWAHLDIAGTAWEEKGRHYLPKGATGTGVRLLVEYLRNSVQK